MSPLFKATQSIPDAVTAPPALEEALRAPLAHKHVTVTVSDQLQVDFKVPSGLEPRSIRSAAYGDVPDEDFVAFREETLARLQQQPGMLTFEQLWKIANFLRLPHIYREEFEILKALGCSPDPKLVGQQKRPYPILDKNFQPTGTAVSEDFGNIGRQVLLTAIKARAYCEISKLPFDAQGRNQLVADALLLKAIKGLEFVDRKALSLRENNSEFLPGVELAPIPEARSRLMGHAKRLQDDGLISEKAAKRIAEIAIRTCGSENFAFFIEINPDGSFKLILSPSSHYAKLRFLDDISVSLKVGEDRTVYGAVLPWEKCIKTSDGRGEGIVGKVMMPKNALAGDYTPVACCTEEVPADQQGQWLSIGSVQDVMSTVIGASMALQVVGNSMLAFQENGGDVSRLVPDLLRKLEAKCSEWLAT